jgi:hypothetical protein
MIKNVIRTFKENCKMIIERSFLKIPHSALAIEKRFKNYPTLGPATAN